MLDTLGVTIGASSLSPEAKIVADYVHDLGGKPESTILGFGGKAPAPWAVFVNGSLGHMLDYDDLGGGHVSIVTVPVAFALAEKCGGMSGRDLITAIAAGADVMTRLTLAIRIPDWTMTEGWFATQLLGFVGGAATAARALGLDEEGTENALGIGFNQMSGSRQMAVGGGLGTRFPLLDTHGFKVWPACGYTRPVNAAVLQLREELGLRPDDVESITVIGGTRATQLLSEPLERKRRPQVSIDGKYSIPFTTAVMMAKGGVTLLDYTDRGLRDPAVLAMADRVSYRPEGSFPAVVGGSSSVSRPTVEIRTKDGKLHARQAEHLPGDPKQPVKREFLEAKFRDCVSFSAKPIPAWNIDRAIEMIRDLEKVPDATEIVKLLA